MKLPSRRTTLLLAVALLVAGVVGVRALRTTTTEISASDALGRYESSVAAVPEPSPAAATTALEQAADAPDAARGATVTDAAYADPGDEPVADAAAASLPEATADDSIPPLRSLPSVGVYPIAVSGGEQLDLATGADRTYPTDGFLTVTPVDCGVDVRTDFVVERWQSIEFCTATDGIELGTERIFHQFFGLDDLVVRQCAASPVAADAASWRCEGEASIADRAVTAETARRDVAGSERDVVVFRTELLEGDHPDNVETIELWVDVETGLPVYETRTYDFTLDTPLGDAGYTEGYEWTVTSLESIG